MNGGRDTGGSAGGRAGAPYEPGFELLERAVGYALGRVGEVPAAALDRPTPCAGWDLRTLLAHTNDSLGALCAGAALGTVDAEPDDGAGGDPPDAWAPDEGSPGSRGPSGAEPYDAVRADWRHGACPAAERSAAADLVATFRSRSALLMGLWTTVCPAAGTPVAVVDRALPSGLLAYVGAVELAVHGWDIARACGLDRPIPRALADRLLAAAVLLVPDDDRAPQFGPVVPVPARACASDRLVAFLGRAPENR
ncbi:maleylpyruvate isomerase family mycothiol-dependent enzyme [Yinghuangia seranimata]|uniref:maleylpyruvate isomerase family mycothiol-dependent enzyme n=1 Tax=Yinghuangia seranimata TaxID=408067 RepID=UPI00248CBBA0|nr:maleylpyruvate isomerase family mycothiol-dependent enzyme [Yinghuangia seranimata]MDI2130755.1 maleylpyruvate isomerase family mycothiol-dependent enzyme [Yinghuangia seranimata]